MHWKWGYTAKIVVDAVKNQVPSSAEKDTEKKLLLVNIKLGQLIHSVKGTSLLKTCVSGGRKDYNTNFKTGNLALKMPQ